MTTFTREDAIALIATQLYRAEMRNKDLFRQIVGCDSKDEGVTILIAAIAQKYELVPGEPAAIALLDAMVAGAALGERNRRMRTQ